MQDLDETTRRRGDFAGGEPIVLANRQAWHFPTVEARPETRNGPAGPVAVPAWAVAGRPADPAFEDAMQAAIGGFAPTIDAGHPPTQQAVIDLATVLLRQNYDLSPAECDWLVYEGFWTQARHDSRFLTLASTASISILRAGVAGPLDIIERINWGLPIHQGRRSEVGLN